MKPITFVLVVATVCLIALRILRVSRTNHVEFVTFSSQKEMSPENPVCNPEDVSETISSAEEMTTEEDFTEMQEELAVSDVSEYPMVVLYDTCTGCAIVSPSVMKEITSGNRAVSRKVFRFLSKSGAEHMMVAPIGTKEISA